MKSIAPGRLGTTASVYAVILAYLFIWAYLVNGTTGMVRTAFLREYPLEWKLIPILLVGINLIALCLVVVKAVQVLTKRGTVDRFFLLANGSMIILLIMNLGTWAVGGLLTLPYAAKYMSPQP